MRRHFLVLILVFSALLRSFADDGSGGSDTPAVPESPAAPDATAPESETEEDLPAVKGGGIAVGGLVTPDTGYAVVSGTVSRDRLTYYGDVILDIGLPKWDDGSSGKYLHVGGMIGMRLTALSRGRGLLLGVGLGGGYSTLVVTDGPAVTTVSDWQIGVVPQFGVRAGSEKGLFGEAIFRLMLPLKPIFVYVGDTPPDTDTDTNSIFRYQAIYMPSARPVSRFYLGFGYTFAN